jgi:hypothetical protein
MNRHNMQGRAIYGQEMEANEQRAWIWTFERYKCTRRQPDKRESENIGMGDARRAYFIEKTLEMGGAGG